MKLSDLYRICASRDGVKISKNIDPSLQFTLKKQEDKNYPNTSITSKSEKPGSLSLPQRSGNVTTPPLNPRHRKFFGYKENIVSKT